MDVTCSRLPVCGSPHRELAMNLKASRTTLKLPLKLVVDQIKTKEDAAAPDADSVIKAIAPLCKAELTKVIERRAAALAQDMLAARVRVEAHARRIDPWDDFAPFSVTDGSDPRDKQWDRFRLKEPVRSAALGEITETSEVHQKKLEEALSAAWTGYVVPAI